MNTIVELFLDKFWVWVGAGLVLAYGVFRRRFGRYGVWFLSAVPVALTLFWGGAHFVDSDEAEHLHAAYLISEGLLPFVDFWQNHSPMTWVILAPLLEVFPASSKVIYLSRLLALLLSSLSFFAIWRLSRLYWGSSARLDLTLVVFASGGIVSQLFWLRPDTLMSLFGLLSLWVSVLGLQGRSGRMLFLSGLLLGFGLSVSTKLALLTVAVPLCAVILHFREIARLLRILAAHGGGVAAGLLPLAFYLWRHDLGPLFFKWVFLYNQRPMALRLDYAEDWIPAVILTLFGVGALSIVARRRLLRAPETLLPVVALGLIGWSTLLIYPVQTVPFCYYLAPLIAIASVHASALGTIRLSRFESPVRALLIGLVFCILSNRGFSTVRSLFAQDAFLGKNLAFVEWMIDHSQGETVLCRVPHHPLFAHDLTRFTVRWQFIRLIENPGSRKARMLEPELPQGEWLEREMQAKRPAIVSRQTYSELVELMLAHRKVDRETLVRLREFLRSEYVPIAQTLYLRRDLVRRGEDAGTFPSE